MPIPTSIEKVTGYQQQYVLPLQTTFGDKPIEYENNW